MSKPCFGRVAHVVFATFITASLGAQQNTPPPSGTAVITGFGGISATSQPGQQVYSPTFAPILLVPFGDRWLLEAEAEFAGNYTRDREMGNSHSWDKGIEYGQLDFLANRYVTIVAGRFLTPFGIYNERLHSGWIRNLPEEPLVASFELTDSNGVMARGGVPVGSVDVSYSVFAAGTTNRSWIQSQKATGGRGSVFFPLTRLEVGGSYQRRTGDDRMTVYGADVTWQASTVPFDLRGEFVSTTDEGRGAWLEGAYRLRRVPFAQPFFSRSQVVLRAEQFSAGSAAAGGGGHGGDVPDRDTQRITAGLNYWFVPNVRGTVAYGRTHTDDGDANVLSLGLTYRFLFARATPRS